MGPTGSGQPTNVVLYAIYVLATGIASGLLFQYGSRVTDTWVRYAVLGLVGVFVLATMLSLYRWTLAVPSTDTDVDTGD